MIDQLLSHLDPAILSHAALAALVWWVTRAAYRETGAQKTGLLDRYEDRLARLEADVEEARAAEDRCLERMTALEERYEARESEMQETIDGLQSEVDRLESKVEELQRRSEPREVS